jgi:transcriptional regulator with XRE-family HTH domain
MNNNQELKRLKKLHKLNQIDIAAACMVSKDLVSKWLKPKTDKNHRRMRDCYMELFQQSLKGKKGVRSA